MKKKVFAGLAVSVLLVYLSVRGIPFGSVADSLRSVRFGCLLAVLAILFLMQVLRSFRWGLILEPIGRVAPLLLFSVTSVGFLAIVAIPARLGELARPYLLSRKTSIPLSSAMGTVLAERALDGLTILVIAFFVLFFTPLPPWLVRSGFLFLLLTITLFAAMTLLIVRQEGSLRLLEPLIGRLSARHAGAVRRLLHHFSEGFRVLLAPRLLIPIAGLSILIWLIDVLAIYLLFLAFGFQLPAVAAFVLMIVLIVGIAIPAAPGFIGNWHYACVVGLGLFGLPQTEALAFAILYHFLSIGIVIVLGLAFLPSNRFSLSDLRRPPPS